MTRRLYYDDQYRRAFDATIRGIERRGQLTAVWLDESAFYPTSGGQPSDTGTLSSFAVADVVDEHDEVVHLVSGQPDWREGQSVHGDIDWDRRFDHMQQHTGQHLLSAAIARVCQVSTVSFHLGRESATIDIARALTPLELNTVEDDANRIVAENRTVSVRYAESAETATLNLRKPSAREGRLRLIEVDDVDLSACGGTHVSQTGAVGAMVIRSWERFRKGQRIEFLCGTRAVHAYRGLRDVIGASVRLLSVLPSELAGAIEHLQACAREQDKTIVELRTERALLQAPALAEAAELIGHVRWVFRAVDADATGLKALASAIVTRPGVVAVLTSPVSPALLVVARSADVALSCDGLVRTLAAAFGGRGGGRPELAQAGTLGADGDVILARARELATPP
ncbi:MAG: alanyl-tRNA editing protein [Vicinamibacterales bacterium]